MFSQIRLSVDLLIVNIEKEMEYIARVRQNEHNPNIYCEYGGRLIGLTTALDEVKKIQIEIDNHIDDIIKNTTDGNYMEKLGVLEDENEVLRNKNYILSKELKKYHKLKNRKIKETPECMKELSENEIESIVMEAYEDDDYENDIYKDE